MRLNHAYGLFQLPSLDWSKSQTLTGSTRAFPREEIGVQMFQWFPWSNQWSPAPVGAVGAFEKPSNNFHRSFHRKSPWQLGIPMVGWVMASEALCWTLLSLGACGGRSSARSGGGPCHGYYGARMGTLRALCACRVLLVLLLCYTKQFFEVIYNYGIVGI